MSLAVNYRLIKAGEEEVVFDLIRRVFDEFVAPDYSAEGQREFLNYASPESLHRHLQANHFILVAEAPDGLAGVIEVRNSDHVSLLFVAKHYQGQGMARELLRHALDLCFAQKPDLHEVSVNSSPYAIPIYERLGFRSQSEEQVINGLRFTPMLLTVARKHEGQST